MLRRSVSWCLVAFVCTIAAGCGSEFAASVSGKVTIDGEPMTKGTVTFAPQGDQGRIAYGDIDANGNYKLTTGQEGGVLPGDYGVTVIATGEAPASDIPPPLITPARYSNVSTSGISKTVSPGKNTINLELTTK